MQRYQRQIILDEVGWRGQKALSESRVLIVGAGGLGTPAALYLAAAGLGKLTVIDGDNVDESNLHRQVLFTKNDIGHNKAEALTEHLRLRSESEITSIAQFLDLQTALTLFPEHDIILDGTDNFFAKYLINDIAVLFDKPVVYGAISDFEGRISIFGGKKSSPCYRCVFPTPPQSKIKNCAEAGVLGPLPGTIGTMQAMEVIKWLLKEKANRPLKPLIGQMQIISLACNESEIIPVHKNQKCFCSKKPTQLNDLPALPQTHSCSIRKAERIDLYNRIVIDVRSQTEWDDFHLANSQHWPLTKIQNNQWPELRLDFSYAFVCKSGGRAQLAIERIRENFPDQNLDLVAYPGSIYDLA